MSELDAAIDRLREASANVQALLAEAGEDQWSKSRLTSGTDAGHSDPTGDTAADPRRLALREELQRAEAVLTLTLSHVTAAHRRLSDAHRRWSGDTEVDT